MSWVDRDYLSAGRMPGGMLGYRSVEQVLVDYMFEHRMEIKKGEKWSENLQERVVAEEEWLVRLWL